MNKTMTIIAAVIFCLFLIGVAILAEREHDRRDDCNSKGGSIVKVDDGRNVCIKIERIK